MAEAEEVTNLDLAQRLKDEMTKLVAEISAATRRLAIYKNAATRLRLGVDPKVVAAEIEATGESMPDGC